MRWRIAMASLALAGSAAALAQSTNDLRYSAPDVEEDDGTATVTVTVSDDRRPADIPPRTLRLSTADLSPGPSRATAGEDYTARSDVTSGVFRGSDYTDGEYSYDFTVNITNDTVLERDEGFQVDIALEPPASATSPREAYVTIVNDEAAPTLRFYASAAAATVGQSFSVGIEIDSTDPCPVSWDIEMDIRTVEALDGGGHRFGATQKIRIDDCTTRSTTLEVPQVADNHDSELGFRVAKRARGGLDSRFALPADQYYDINP